MVFKAATACLAAVAWLRGEIHSDVFGDVDDGASVYWDCFLSVVCEYVYYN
mgnify:CR=1 FL=1